MIQVRVAPLWVVLGLFVVLCSLFNAQTPYRKEGLYFPRGVEKSAFGKIPDVGAPDERQHANYVRHLMDGKGFPVLVPGSPDLGETYQSHQPPLFYVIAAGWCSVLGADPVSPDSGFRFRFLNTLIGCGTIVGVYFAVLWGLGRREIAFAGASLGLLPMFIGLHAAVSNDPLLYLLCTWTFALLVKCVQQGWHWKPAVLIGILAGLALLTKTTALVLLPTVGAGLVWSALRHGDQAKPPMLVWAGALATPLVVAAPWLLRNKSLYGDFFAVSAFNASFTGSPQASSFVEGLGAPVYWMNMVLWWTARSAIGVFGNMDIFLQETKGRATSDTLYLLSILLIGLACVAAFLTYKKNQALADEEGKPSQLPFTLISAVLAVFVTGLFVRFNMQYFQGQARYLFPAFVVAASLFGTGLVSILGERRERAWIVGCIVLLALDVVAYVSIKEGFAIRLGS